MPVAQRVFITGASSGIGCALANHYAKQGAVLGLAARRVDTLKSLAEALSAQGAQQVRCYPLDVTDNAALRAAAENFIASAGRIATMARKNEPGSVIRVMMVSM